MLARINLLLFVDDDLVLVDLQVWPSDRRSVLAAAKSGTNTTVIPVAGGSIYSLALSDKYLVAGTYENLIQVCLLLLLLLMMMLLLFVVALVCSPPMLRSGICPHSR